MMHSMAHNSRLVSESDNLPSLRPLSQSNTPKAWGNPVPGESQAANAKQAHKSTKDAAPVLDGGSYCATVLQIEDKLGVVALWGLPAPV
jgi:hypothetical protein